MDSRFAPGGGLSNPLVGNTAYSIPGFVTTGTNWATYGGNSTSDCGLNDTVGNLILVNTRPKEHSGRRCLLGQHLAQRLGLEFESK
jgi:hypothetical protein